MFCCQALFHWFSHWSGTVLAPGLKYKHARRPTLVNKAVATKAWSEKRKQTPRTEPPVGAAQHLIQLIKWLIGLLKVVSGPDNAVMWGGGWGGGSFRTHRHTQIGLDSTAEHSWSEKNKLYWCWQRRFTQWITAGDCELWTEKRLISRVKLDRNSSLVWLLSQAVTTPLNFICLLTS